MLRRWELDIPVDSNGLVLKATVWRSLKDLEGHTLFTKRLGEG
jgi:hypothetical protein